MTEANKTLWKEQGAMLLLSLGMYAALFLIMEAAELLWADRFAGRLLQWSSPAFCVGIPASILGTAYVLTVRNPQNYTGFYPGILMSALLAVQCLLQGQPDLFVLYVFVFIPFQAMSLFNWHKAAKGGGEGDLRPSFLGRRMQLLTLAVVALLVVADYALNTWLLSDAKHVGEWGYNLTVKLLGALMIASSLAANFWLIYKKNDAWVGWIVYCVSGLAMFTKLGNVFSMLLFLVMLAINTSAFMAWLKQSKN